MCVSVSEKHDLRLSRLNSGNLTNAVNDAIKSRSSLKDVYRRVI